MAGFTVLESLVALAAFGLLLLILGQSTRLAVEASRVQSRLLAAGPVPESLDAALRRLIGRIDGGGPGGRPARFSGGPSALTFTATLPDAFGSLPSREADFALGLDGGHRLVLTWRPRYRVRLGPAPAPGIAVLAEGVARFDAAYWPPAGGPWVGTWSAATLPRLVRLRLVPDSGAAVELTIAPVRDRWRP